MYPDQLAQFQKDIAAALAAIPGVSQLAGNNNVEELITAYNTGDWSGVRTLSGKPFTKEQQQAAVTAAEKALNPAYKAQEAYDLSVTEDSLRNQREGYDQFRDSEEIAFGKDKNTLDQNAADQGILFSGSRFQKLKDLRSTYEDRDRIQRDIVADNVRSTARSHQYKYGDKSARGLRDYYELPGAATYNPNVAGGKVGGGGLTSLYNTRDFNFQGTAPVAQKAAVQTRAASLLGNQANKLSSVGYKTQY